MHVIQNLLQDIFWHTIGCLFSKGVVSVLCMLLTYNGTELTPVSVL